MAIYGRRSASDFYSYKDWNNTLFNALNGGIDGANSVIGQIKAKKQGATGGGTFNSDGSLIGNTKGLKALNANNTTGVAGSATAGSATTSAAGVSGTGVGTNGGIGGGSAKGFGSGMAWGAIGKAGNDLSQLGVNLIGNQYKSDAQRIAYGDSTYSSVSRKDLNKNLRNYTNMLNNEAFASNSNNMTDLAKELEDGDIYRSISQNPTRGQNAAALTQSVLNNTGKGFEIGSKIAGPWGGLIGAAAGTIAGTIGGLFRKRSGRERMAKIREAEQRANINKNAQIQDSIANLNTRNMNNYFAQTAAYGGKLYSQGGRLIKKYAHKFADGGLMENDTKIGSNATSFPGITEFNTGGSHEENPYGGIPQGIAPDGAPNLVEEGEVKIGDIVGGINQYILSARLVIDGETASQFGINPKFVGLTYADAFRQAYKPYKERTGNAEVKNEIAHLCNIFQQAQDAEKAKREMQEQLAVMASMPPEQQAQLMNMEAQEQTATQGADSPQDSASEPQDNINQQALQEVAAPQASGSPDAAQQSQLSPEEQAVMQQQMAGGQPMMAYGGKVRRYDFGGALNVLKKYKNHKFENGGFSPRSQWPYYNMPLGMENSADEFDYPSPLGEYPKSSAELSDDTKAIWEPSPRRPVGNIRQGVRWRRIERMQPELVDEDEPEEDELPKNIQDAARIEWAKRHPASDDEESPAAKRDRILDELGDGYERYARHLDKSGIVGNALLLANHDRYKLNAEKYNDIIKEGLGKSMVSAAQVGHDYRPNYVDPNFDNHLLQSSTSQALRNAAMQSSGNRSMAAALAANIYKNANEARGKQLYQALVANEDIRNKAYQANKAIEQDNARNKLSADTQNAASARAAYDEIEKTTASADQYNKKLRFDLAQNMINLMSKYGVNARNKHRLNVMIANGLYGKGAESVAPNN